MAIENRTDTDNRVVVGHFSNGEDAHRAIDNLTEEGFTASQIGAAFHGESPSQSALASNPGTNFGAKTVSDVNIRTNVSPGTSGSGSGITGPASDTSAVTPAGLATGAGTATAGASRPGPIPGSDIPSTLPTSLRSNLPSEADQPRSVPKSAYPATGGFHETTHHNESWWEKLKHVFGGDSGDKPSAARVDASSQNFGTGQGHLGVNNDYDREYSRSDFESSFAVMGVQPEYSRYLVGELGRGGAIVTVEAGARSAEAESILELNGARVRYDSNAPAATDVWEAAHENARVHVFGQMQNYYRREPNSMDAKPMSNLPSRKAS
jgi:hypothetical protein